MTQHIPLDFGDPVHEGFFDAIQELLGAAIPSLNITVLNATTLQVNAGTNDEQAAVVIDGRYRWRTSPTTAALPGGLSNGTHPVFVTASDNNFTGPQSDPDSPTDYSFGLQILASGNTPGTALHRQVGEVDVVSNEIRAYRQTAGPRARDGQPIYARAEHSSQRTAVLHAIPTQTANVLEVLTAAGTRRLYIDTSGNLVRDDSIPTVRIQVGLAGPTGQVGIRLGDDSTIYRHGANALTVTGALRIQGNVGFYDTLPIPKPTVTGPRHGNAALQSLLEQLALLGLITNNTSP